MNSFIWAQLITFLLVLGIIIGVIHFFKKSTIFTLKATNYWILAYVVVIVASTLYMTFFFNNEVNKSEISNTDFEKDYSALEKGNIDKLKEEHLKDTFVFTNYQEKSLHIDFSEYYADIFVERSTQHKDLIEGYLFFGYLTKNGYDFSKYVKPYQVKIRDGRLIIVPQHLEIELSLGSLPFPSRQISEKTLMDHSEQYERMDIQSIYLIVPADLTITSSDNVMIQYIN
ncbi:hypothetical protein LC087_02310 [Bacillus carboniphilus]|uniref:Uncharacterized protein n=1 Tax=Bacillus carboniphilus TaxID=86663 RepID=A0ABY9JUK3_9BACI|nr:hypothetical protein [Bacillus carboniphilus]WLR43069.1 hypothetical protein LC087_02310 [Bacillus carboniphilus]